MSAPLRQPKGVPVGGQYAENSHDEAGSHLADHDVLSGETPRDEETPMTWMRTTRPLPELHLESKRFTAMNYTETYDGQKYELNPPYQRGSVWTLEQRRNLIQSFLLGIPIGAVITNFRGYDTKENERVFGSPAIYGVVDGKQRIETLVAFSKDEFSVPADWWEDRDIRPDEVDTEGMIRHSGLTPVGQTRAAFWSVPTEESRVKNLAAEAMIFRLINTGGTEQTEQSIARAKNIEENA